MQLDCPAFVLTRGWRDTPAGLLLTFWLLTPHGPVRARLGGQRAVMFVERGTEVAADARRPLELRTLHGDATDALYFHSRKKLLLARDEIHLDGNACYESDIKPSERFLMERFITAGCRLRGEGRQRRARGAGQRSYIDCQDPRLTRHEFQPQLRVASIDIETDGLSGPLLSIAVTCGEHEQVLMVGDESASGSSSLRYLRDERALLRAFFEHIQQLDPDALIGWNVVDFDLLYLQKRSEHLGVSLALGRAGERARILVPQRAGQLALARVPGRVVLDGIGLLKSATFSFERFSLEYVAQQLLGVGKSIAQPNDRVGEIMRMFREDKPALAEYNLQDCRLVQQIFAKADLLSFAIERQRMTGLPLDRVGGSVAAFDNLYLPRLHRAGFVAADIGAGTSVDGSPGGYVLASSPGLYENVLVLDFKSLYPSIIRTFRVDPMGLAQPGEEPLEGFGGARFSREQHILPGLIEQLWADRDVAKAADNTPLSRAIKIIMNSFYGVLGTPGCRFFSHLLASSITRRGHEIMTRSRDWIQQHDYRVIYGDTDSLFVLVGAGKSADECHKIGAELSAALNRFWVERIAEEHRVESCLEMEFEVHYRRFFMPTLRGSDVGSAKRYAGLVCDPEPRVVVKGLEAVRTDWTPLARRFQRELLRRVFQDEPVEGFLRQIRARLLNGELDDELVYRKRLRRRLEDYSRSAPPHVRAARMLGRPVKEINYVWTARGPQPASMRSAPLDHHHYLQRQLAPAADGILHCLGTSFERVAGDQVSLF